MTSAAGATVSAVTSPDEPPVPPSIASLILQDVNPPLPPASPELTSQPSTSTSSRQDNVGSQRRPPKTLSSPSSSRPIPISNDDVIVHLVDGHDSDSSVSPVILHPPSFVAQPETSQASPVVARHLGKTLTLFTSDDDVLPVQRNRIKSEPCDRRSGERHNDGGDVELQRAIELSRLSLRGE